MLYLVCHDISDDKLRGRLSDRLLDYGVRIQESVFECLLDEEMLERMITDLGRMPLAASEKVRIYSVCRRCVQQVRIYGPGCVTEQPDYYLV